MSSVAWSTTHGLSARSLCSKLHILPFTRKPFAFSNPWFGLKKRPMSELTTSSSRSPLPSSKGTDPVSTRLIESGVTQKLEHLLSAVKGKRTALILTHDNPDPDSLAAAVALEYLLERRAGIESKVAYGGIIGRSENAALVKVLHLRAYPVSEVSLADYDLRALVDTQPS